MARGWESKSVEDQIDQAAIERASRGKRSLDAREVEQLKRKESLLLERARLLREMERAYKRRHLVILERGLRYLDEELMSLEQSDKTTQ